MNAYPTLPPLLVRTSTSTSERGSELASVTVPVTAALEANVAFMPLVVAEAVTVTPVAPASTSFS